MQALAAEDVEMKPRIAKSGAIQPLVTMVKTGLPLSCQDCFVIPPCTCHLSVLVDSIVRDGLESINTAIFIVLAAEELPHISLHGQHCLQACCHHQFMALHFACLWGVCVSVCVCVFIGTVLCTQVDYILQIHSRVICHDLQLATGSLLDSWPTTLRHLQHHATVAIHADQPSK